MLCRGTVIARNIRRRKEQFPSKTLIVSGTKKEVKLQQRCTITRHVDTSHLHPCLLCLFPFSPYLCHLCAPTHCVHWNLLPFHSFRPFHTHRLENVQHRHYSNRLICSVLQEEKVFCVIEISWSGFGSDDYEINQR